MSNFLTIVVWLAVLVILFIKAKLNMNKDRRQRTNNQPEHIPPKDSFPGRNITFDKMKELQDLKRSLERKYAPPQTDTPVRPNPFSAEPHPVPQNTAERRPIYHPEPESTRSTHTPTVSQAPICPVTSEITPKKANTVVNTDELMNTVEDLIVTGYQAHLPYERDFIAEGMDILSRYKIN